MATVQDVTLADQVSNLRLIFYMLEVNWSFRVLGNISCVSVWTAHVNICTVPSGQLLLLAFFQTHLSDSLIQNYFVQVVVLSLVHSRFLFTRTWHKKTFTFKKVSQLSCFVLRCRTLSAQLILWLCTPAFPNAGVPTLEHVVLRNTLHYSDDTVCILNIRSKLAHLLLKPTGHVMHQQFNIQQFYALPTMYLCVLYLSENKQRLVPLTA